jgi:hypothetical protein
MLAHEAPAKYQRPIRPAAIAPYECAIHAMLIEDEKKPRYDQRTMRAIYKTLRDRQGYTGGYDALRRQCRKARFSHLQIAVRVDDTVTPAASLTVTRVSRSYQLRIETPEAASTLVLALQRDCRVEQALEISNWINQLRGSRLEAPLRSRFWRWSDWLIDGEIEANFPAKLKR